ncbi:hypothetical protein EYF80_046598 [Liparis tanakae]|uniref:Uncharacterized protein n=1 Tax=Liparis tanakae TaxID=230148 RepID=A0A4Z2FPN5_9TELE|nr:hypothetical protein EYF80_046598 [Liparis tanakae]
MEHQKVRGRLVEEELCKQPQGQEEEEEEEEEEKTPWFMKGKKRHEKRKRTSHNDNRHGSMRGETQDLIQTQNVKTRKGPVEGEEDRRGRRGGEEMFALHTSGWRRRPLELRVYR